MNLSIKAIPRFIPISLIVIGIGVLPLLFSGGCNFDPYQNMTTGDTATYKISGVITGPSYLPVAGIRVYLFDSTNSNSSNPSTATDTTGTYSITWPYSRRNTLYLKVEDINLTTSGSYANKTVEISFDIESFKYGIQKNKPVQLDTFQVK